MFIVFQFFCNTFSQLLYFMCESVLFLQFSEQWFYSLKRDEKEKMNGREDKKKKKKKQSKFKRGREEIKNKKNSCFLSVTK